MKTHLIKRFIGFSLLVIAGIFTLSFVVMELWNWLMPYLFTGTAIINYWQALGILALSKILFGGFHRKCRCRCSHKGYWQSRFKNKWDNLDQNEREKIKKWCGTDCSDSETK